MVSAGETKVLGENLPRRYFIHKKSHLPDLGANPDRRGGKPAVNRFSYDRVHCLYIVLNYNNNNNNNNNNYITVSFHAEVYPHPSAESEGFLLHKLFYILRSQGVSNLITPVYMRHIELRVKQ
jgi:hypothetical protein